MLHLPGAGVSFSSRGPMSDAASVSGRCDAAGADTAYNSCSIGSFPPRNLLPGAIH